MTHEAETSLSGAEVLSRAKLFFANRVPASAAFPEKEGAGYLCLRGAGGEEISLAVSTTGTVTRVRGSTLLFDQAVNRFFSTLPAVEVA